MDEGATAASPFPPAGKIADARREAQRQREAVQGCLDSSAIFRHGRSARPASWPMTSCTRRYCCDAPATNALNGSSGRRGGTS
jgi:hypothetical protein